MQHAPKERFLFWPNLACRLGANRRYFCCSKINPESYFGADHL